jgi:NAD(P)-dependent dehydrogenase (short-subunit alcohol dehydrogenase family)
MAENDRENMYDALGATLPLGRIGETDDAAKAYVALMDQDYVTGTVAVVDGGTLIA